MFLLLLLLALAAEAREWNDVEFARPGGVSLTLDAWAPDAGSKGPVLLLVHGGGWEAGDKRTYIQPWFSTLTQAGIPWVTINYRLGPQYKHPAAVEDIEAAVRWLKRHAREMGVNGQQIVVMGESAGAHLGALAALRGKLRVAGFVGFYGIYDVPQWVVQRGELMKNLAGYLRRGDAPEQAAASPIRYLKAGGPRLLLVHGKGDAGVPYAQSTAFCEAARQKQISCEMLLLEGAPHGVENWEGNPAWERWKLTLLKWLR